MCNLYSITTNQATIIKVEPVGEFTLKGIRRPMAAYNVIASSKPN
jgi:hypothetical protein